MHSNIAIFSGSRVSCNSSLGFSWVTRVSWTLKCSITYTVKSRVLTCVTNQKISLLPKGHSKYGSKISFIRDLKRPACASIRYGLVLATIRYVKQIAINLLMSAKKLHEFISIFVHYISLRPHIFVR